MASEGCRRASLEAAFRGIGLSSSCRVRQEVRVHPRSASATSPAFWSPFVDVIHRKNHCSTVAEATLREVRRPLRLGEFELSLNDGLRGRI